jgi:hypothetical protein
MLSGSIVSNANPITLVPFVNAAATYVQQGIQVPTGATTRVQMLLWDGQVGTSNVLDSGQLDAKADWTTGLSPQLSKTVTTGGGLTAEQAQALDRVDQSVGIANPVGSLATPSLGVAPPGGFIGAQLPTPVFAIIVRITEVPLWLEPQTPDGDYWVKTLATVRVLRGSDLWLRVPIHTSSKFVFLWGEGLGLGLQAFGPLVGWLLDMSVQVQFGDGVAGEVLYMRVP